MDSSSHENRTSGKKLSRREFFRYGLAGIGGLSLAGGLLSNCSVIQRAEPPRIAKFLVEATPPVGSHLAYGTAERIDDPLSSRGVVILTEELPIVLVSVDWIGISNSGYDAWKMALAEAAGTSPDRVAVHTLHQHDTPGCDFDLEQMMLARGLECDRFDAGFAWETIRSTAAAVNQSLGDVQPVTHLGTGEARVEKFASTRRLLGEDGKVKYTRYTSTDGKPELRELPEGLIDPDVRVISFWNRADPVAALTYYATHPQSYYREGGVSCDTVGIARRMREEDTLLFHLHFNGAGGNIGAGKYNDGSHENRAILASRLADGIAEAWSTTERVPVTADDITWKVKPVLLPAEIRNEDVTYSEEELIAMFTEEPGERLAREIAWMHRCKQGQTITLSSLQIGSVQVLHMPGELNVEYQLAARQMRPDLFVSMAAYGDLGPGYICTRASYPKGGYEAGRVSRVSPGVEEVLTSGMRYLLETEDSSVMPSDFTMQKQLFS